MSSIFLSKTIFKNIIRKYPVEYNSKNSKNEDTF